MHIIKERSRPGGRPDDPSQPYESMLFNTFPNIPVVYPRSAENGSQCCGGLSVSESMFERGWTGGARALCIGRGTTVNLLDNAVLPE